MLAYEEQLAATSRADIVSEVRFKIALCLVELDRGAEGEAILAEVAGGSAGRWPLLASCHLWARRVEARDMKEAGAILSSISSQYDLRSLARIVPMDMRDRILDGYLSYGSKFSIYAPHVDLVEHQRQSVQVAELLATFEGTINEARWNLMKAYLLAQRDREALGHVEGWLREIEASEYRRSFSVNLFSYYGWMLRDAGRAQDALESARKWRAQGSLKAVEMDFTLGLEEVRALAALGRIAEAERTLDVLMGEGPVWRVEGCFLYDAYAMKGLFREMAGDSGGARAAWLAGLDTNWRYSVGLRLTSALIMASLSDHLDEGDMAILIGRIGSMVATDLPVDVLGTAAFKGALSTKALRSVFLGMFRNGRGRPLAKQIVFQEIPFRDVISALPTLLVFELMRSGAFGDGMSPEEDAVVWRVAGGIFEGLIQNGEIDKTMFVQLLLAWQGSTAFVGWAGAAPRLKAELRAPLTYVMGRRLVALGRTGEAVSLFGTVAGDAGATEQVKALAATAQASARPGPRDGK
ncbi:MAG TPA: hypothetical protein PLU30_02580 [Verrucomicrobiae bacterium]|nr:hypothetical protein [Verrucomicrobiae bacterium]